VWPKFTGVLAKNVATCIVNSKDSRIENELRCWESLHTNYLTGYEFMMTLS